MDMQTEAPVREVVATSFAIVIAISDGRQITFQSGYSDDEPDAVVNARLDRNMRLADRLAGRYELPTLDKERVDIERFIAQVDQDMAEAERNYAKAQAGLDEQIAELQGMHKKEFDEGYARHRSGGREGSYVPKGASKATLDRINAGIDQVKAQKDKNDAERDQFLQSTDKGLTVRRRRLAEIAARVAEIQAQLE